MVDEHTSGPWEIWSEIDDDGISDVIVRRGSDELLFVAEVSGTFADATGAANARLIAAAPDLLAACKVFCEAWEKSLQLEKTDIALRLARTAIAKAEGG